MWYFYVAAALVAAVPTIVFLCLRAVKRPPPTTEGGDGGTGISSVTVAGTHIKQPIVRARSGASMYASLMCLCECDATMWGRM